MEIQKQIIEEQVVNAVKHVFDPEIPINIYDLGLIYELKIDDDFNVYVLMTLTTANCPVAEDMPGMVLEEIRKVPGIKEVKVDLTFEPPWDKEMLSQAALLELGLL